MKSLTTIVFLDILRRRGNEIFDNLDELPMSTLYNLKEDMIMAFEQRQDKFIKLTQDELYYHMKIWNQEYPKWEIFSIGVNRAARYKDRISIFMNIRNHELIVLELSIYSVYVRKNSGNKGWDWCRHEVYAPDILIKRYPKLPWIEEFSDWVDSVYRRYVN